MRDLSSIWPRSAVGLDIGEESVKVVELNKNFKQIRIKRFGQERIDPSESAGEGVGQAIQRLFERLHIRQKEVVIHLGGGGVRTVVLESPPLPFSDLQDWIHEQIVKKLPMHTGSSKIIVSYHVLNRNEKGFRIMAAYCQRTIVEERLALVERAGLIPVMLGAGSLDLFPAFAFEESDLFGRTVLFVEVDSGSTNFLLVEDGSPVSYRTMGSRVDIDGEMGQMLSELKNEEHSGIDRIVVVGDRAARSRLDGLRQHVSTVEVGFPLKSLRENNGLTPEYTRAAGLALKKLYPLFNTIDLLPEDRKIIVRNQREKKRALSSMLGFGAFFLIILLVLTVIKLIQAGELEDVEAQMFALNEQIFAAEQIQKEQINLQQALLDMQNLVTRRSRVAEFLEALSSTLPRNVWLQEFSCELEGVSDGETGKPVVIRGWAFDEAQMAAFLSRLESFDFLRDVQLQGTERIPADEVWKRSRLRKISLIEFTISASLKND